MLNRCIAYLGLPRVIGLLLAGRIHLEDFFLFSAVSLSVAIQAALRELAASHVAMEVAVDMPMLLALPLPIQELLVILFEQAEGRELLPGRVRTGDIEKCGNLELPFQIRTHRSK